MKKLLKLLDDNLLRFGVAFAILFTALYPKLPSVHITNTWVYIRLEDFLILALAIFWFIQLLRKKVSLPRPVGYVLVLYWIVGLASLIYCLIFIAPHLSNFYPKIAALQYGRRIEYMILFFIAFSTIRNVKDVYFYLITLCITVAGIIVYGFGQRFYFVLWSAFPNFFQQYPYCFPAFLTGNEEFAKGIPLCFNESSRITSTFGGHYDLSAYIVLVIPILIALVFVVKRVWLKVLIAILALFSLELLNFTSSRTSFGAYVIGVAGMLILWHKKRWIIPILVLSVGVMLLFGNSTIQRFTKTIQQVQVVSSDKALSADLQKIISDAKKAEAGQKPEVPPASDFTVGSGGASQSAFTTVLTDEELQRIKDDSIDISSVSGSFLIKKAYALDISFTTRFQAEWPRNWNAFLYSPVFGTGYSSLTLATDNDYLRALGETGLLGLLSFLLIFVILGIFMKNTIGLVKDGIVKALLYGLAGGIIGLLINAVLIDVFEASKVAEPMWMLLGIGVGAASLYLKHPINYKQELYYFFTSYAMLLVYLLLLILVTYVGSASNFFVADDFTWLRWAATSVPGDLLKYFIDTQDFFYRPLDKTIIYFLYMLFSFKPEGYHLFILLLHLVTVIGVFILSVRLTKSKLLGFLTAGLFAIHSAHTENIFWFSTISVELCSLFIVYMMIAFLRFRERKSIVAYIVAILLCAFAFVSYELAIIIPFVLLVLDIFIAKTKLTKKTVLSYLPFIILVISYFVIRYYSHAFSGGGDYSYNIARIVPNVIGNFFGYTGLFFGGISFLSLYDILRDGLRAQWLTVSLFAVVIVGLGGFILYQLRKQVSKATKHPLVSLIIFAFVFAFVALLPFLPLGNIAPRYNYLASVGFSLATVLILYVLLKRFIQNKKYHILALIVIMSVLVGWHIRQNSEEQKKWYDGGTVTKQTLTFFRTGYSSFSPEKQLYFVNTPVKQNGVWVFPVGLADGLWFIYREDMPVVKQVTTIDEAKRAESNNPSNTFIFRFDEHGKISEVK